MSGPTSSATGRPPLLVLASASPRRRQLLDSLGLVFEVRPADVEEVHREGETPSHLVARLAADKAQAVAADGELVLAADTIVVRDGVILGKPTDSEHAKRMLTSLAGVRHSVLSSVGLLDGTSGRLATTVERSEVTIAPMTSAEIAWYVATGEPLDKAGAYAIQGLGALFVEAVDGNYTNVVGLPLPAVRRLFGELGHDLLDFRG